MSATADPLEKTRAKMEKYGSINFHSEKLEQYIRDKIQFFSKPPEAELQYALSEIITRLQSIREKIVHDYPTMLSSTHRDKTMIDLLQDYIDKLESLRTSSAPLNESYVEFTKEMVQINSSLSDIRRILNYFVHHVPKPLPTNHAANNILVENVKSVSLNRLGYFEFNEFMKAIENSFTPSTPIERKRDVVYSITKELMKYVFIYYPELLITNEKGNREKFYNWLSKKEDNVDDMTEVELTAYAGSLYSHLTNISAYNTRKTLEKIGGSRKHRSRRTTRRHLRKRSRK